MIADHEDAVDGKKVWHEIHKLALGVVLRGVEGDLFFDVKPHLAGKQLKVQGVEPPGL